MKKWIAALCALILLVGGVVIGYVVYKRGEAADVRGSSTEEFVTTEEEENPGPRSHASDANDLACCMHVPVALEEGPPVVGE